MRIISLSTIPPRFPLIRPTLQSLVEQRGGIDEIRLYVPRRYRRFPDYDGALPEVPKGVTVVRVEEDLGPATKVLYAARDLRGTDAQILFCDDDRLFRPTWAEELFREQAARPRECVSLFGKFLPPQFGWSGRPQPSAGLAGKFDPEYRVRRLRQQFANLVLRRDRPREMRRPIARAGYADLLLGVGGVVVRPDFITDDAFDIPPVLWTVDDVWLSGILAKNDVPIWLPARFPKPASTETDYVEALYLSTIEGAGRLEANRRCIDYMRERYGVWR